MAMDERFDDAITRWLEETASPRVPDRVLDTTFERTRRTRQELDWRGLLGRSRMVRLAPLLGTVAAVAVLTTSVGLQLTADRPIVGGPLPVVPLASGTPTPSLSATVAPTPTTPPYAAAVGDLLDDFIAARIAGSGAGSLLEDPEADIPLLYATSTGAAYERGEFEVVPGIEWPYELSAFRVRLFAGATVVEQLLFTSAERGQTLHYEPTSYGTELAPTTEDGEPWVADFDYFDGDVTLSAAHPWIMSDFGFTPFGRLIPEGPPSVPPTTDGGQRNDWDHLYLIADPTAGVGMGCPEAAPDVDALVEGIRSQPGIEVGDPVEVRVGDADALMVDVVVPTGATVTVPVDEGGDFCANGVLFPVFPTNSGYTADAGGATGESLGSRMRLVLLEAPEGSSVRILAVAVAASEATYERAFDAAAPVIDSVAFRSP